MIVEERTYTLLPGSVPKVLAMYEAEGLPIQSKHLGRMVGYFTTETGTLNQIVQMWAYDNWETRSRRRSALWSDPAWIAFDKKVQPYLMKMVTRLLNPTPWSPIR